MGSRPLRQHYDHDVPLARAGDVDELLDVWHRHRTRMLDALGDLDEAQWSAPSRCESWDVRDVVLHLVTVDSFWVVSLDGARTGTPTRYLGSFDPTDTPEALIAPMRTELISAVLERFAAGTDALRAVVGSLTAEQWLATAESPLGHVPAHLALAHGFWDSWLHERDVLVPLALAPAPEVDDVLVALDYSLLAAGVQGGLVDDPGAVGDGPAAPIDVSFAVEEQPGLAMRVRVGGLAEGVHVERGGASGEEPTVSALALVEGFTGRAPLDHLDDLPEALLAQVTRAQQVL